MRTCDYKILEHARSELHHEGIAFAVVIRAIDGSTEMRAYNLSQVLDSLFESPFDELIQVTEFIADLEGLDSNDRHSEDIFFRSLDNLNTGPIRIFSAGRCDHVRFSSANARK